MRRTQEVLKEMLQENTGAALCDSGGAYGRHWERNQSRDFDSEPPTTMNIDKHGMWIYHNVYYWLSDRLEYSEEIDKEFQEYSSLQEYSSYMEDVDGFILNRFPEEHHGDWDNWVNTFNGEDCLSQTLQYRYVEAEEGVFVFLQIHNGCDVRGGYTAPRVFEVLGEGYSFDNARCTLYCGFCSSSWYSDDGGYSFDDLNVHEFIELKEGEKITFPKTTKITIEQVAEGVNLYFRDNTLFCPICGNELKACD